jgi:lipopolysaccharide transport protein LptA
MSMAASNPDRRLLWVLLLCLPLTAPAATAPKRTKASKPPSAVTAPQRARPAAAAAPAAATAAATVPDIVLDAGSSQIDYSANRLAFTDVTISQGELRIRADKAEANGTGLRFDDSRWEFSGNVRIAFPNGTLTATDASVRFAGNRMAIAQARGAPAQFEQQLASLPRPVRGRAGRIDFDFIAQTLKLSQDAWLFDGRNEMASPGLLYDIREQVARSETKPGAGERVQITIRPESGEQINLPAPAKPVDKR